MVKYDNMIGQKYNHLTVIEIVEKVPNKKQQVIVECDCENHTQMTVNRDNLVCGNTKSCGCQRSENGKKKLHDLTGQIFGDLTVVKRNPVNAKNGHARWDCICICGNFTTVTSSDLISGNTKSCGCSVPRFEDLTGEIFDSLFVMARIDNDKHNNALWLCDCICDSIVIVDSHSLLTGHTSSCGCYREEIVKKESGESSFTRFKNNYRQNAKKDGREFNLSDEVIKATITQNCKYCGIPPLQIIQNEYGNGDLIYNGIDRIDNTKDYNPDNIVPCCDFCNHLKSNMHIEDFYQWVAAVYENLNLATYYPDKLLHKEIKIKPFTNNNWAAFNRLKNDYIKSEEIKGIKLLISDEVFKTTIAQDCFYCNRPPLQRIHTVDSHDDLIYNGIDRIDNSKDYTSDNIRPCCSTCNYAKNSYTETEFCMQIKKIYEHRKALGYGWTTASG
jgi:hypothetical protein